MSAPTLSASKWDSKRGGWIVPRNIYRVWWHEAGQGIVEKYVVADTKSMAISKSMRKWKKRIEDGSGFGGRGATLLIRKGVKKPPYAPPKVHLK